MSKLPTTNPQFYKFLKALKEAYGPLEEIYTKIMSVVEGAAESEAALKETQARLEEMERVGKVDIDLRLKQYGVNHAKTMVEDAGYKILEQRDLDEIIRSQQEAVEAHERLEAEVSKKIGAAVGRAKKDTESEYNVNIATLEAQLAGLRDKITTLEKNNADLLRVNQELNETNRQHAGAQSVVNVGSK